MKVLGDRVSILKKENLVSVVVLASNDKKKLFLLFTWLLAWTVCGIVVFGNYFNAHSRDQKIFIIVYLAFWAYFEINIIRSFIWKRWGKEKIWIQDGILYYQKEVNRKGKIREWNVSLISRVDIIELKPGRWADTLSQSYWIKGGERLQFESQGKIVQFGMQINDSQASEIKRELNRLIRS
jgi:hypothetical protein